MPKHPGSIRRHGRGFEIRLCVAGTRHGFTVRCEDRREAQQWARKQAGGAGAASPAPRRWLPRPPPHVGAARPLRARRAEHQDTRHPAQLPRQPRADHAVLRHRARRPDRGQGARGGRGGLPQLAAWAPRPSEGPTRAGTTAQPHAGKGSRRPARDLRPGRPAGSCARATRWPGRRRRSTILGSRCCWTTSSTRSC